LAECICIWAAARRWKRAIHRCSVRPGNSDEHGYSAARASKRPSYRAASCLRARRCTKLAWFDKSRGEALMRSLISTHTILGVRPGEFVSLLDPPEAFREAAAGCRNIGTWPALVGEEGERDGLLSSPGSATNVRLTRSATPSKSS